MSAGPTTRGRALHGIPPVALEDIRDVRQYVGAIVARRWGKLPHDEQDELALEGLVVVYELHARWRPAECPSFRAFCSTYVPLRLIQWWRKEMRMRNGTARNGKTGEYRHSEVVSLDALPADALMPADGRGRKAGIREAA